VFATLDRLAASGALKVSRAAYFVGAMKRVFEKFGLNWQRRDA